MYCPQCRAEYRDGFTECSDCQVPLSAGTPPPKPPGRCDPALDLVVVLVTYDAIQLAMVKGLLEDAGISFVVLDEITSLVAGVDGFLHKWVRVQVARDREAEARALLETVLEPDTGALGAGEDGANRTGEST